MVGDSQKESSEEFKIKLKTYIEETGYPVELKVENIFSSYNFGVSCNKYYIDEDEKKGREVDICAYKNIILEKPHLLVGLGLICEVKQSKKYPWVVFSTKRRSVESEGWLKLHFTIGQIDSKILTYDDLVKKCTTIPLTRIGRSYAEGFKKNDVNSNIFEALTTASKAAEHWLKTNQGHAKTLSKPLEIIFAEPIVVLDGLLFEAWLDENNKIILNEANHLAISFGYISENYSRSGYLVEVVTLNELPTLILKKIDWLNYIYEVMTKNISTK